MGSPLPRRQSRSPYSVITSFAALLSLIHYGLPGLLAPPRALQVHPCLGAVALSFPLLGTFFYQVSRGSLFGLLQVCSSVTFPLWPSLKIDSRLPPTTSPCSPNTCHHEPYAILLTGFICVPSLSVSLLSFALESKP